MEDESRQKQNVIDAIMRPKSLAPQKQRINNAQAVKDHGQQKIMAVPQHCARLIFCGAWISPSFPQTCGGEGAILKTPLSPLARGEGMEITLA